MMLCLTVWDEEAHKIAMRTWVAGQAREAGREAMLATPGMPESVRAEAAAVWSDDMPGLDV